MGNRVLNRVDAEQDAIERQNTADHEAECAWREKYKQRIFDICQDEQIAETSSEAAEYEPDYDPEACAEDEISCWDD